MISAQRRAYVAPVAIRLAPYDAPSTGTTSTPKTGQAHSYMGEAPAMTSGCSRSKFTWPRPSNRESPTAETATQPHTNSIPRIRTRAGDLCEGAPKIFDFNSDEPRHAPSRKSARYRARLPPRLLNQRHPEARLRDHLRHPRRTSPPLRLNAPHRSTPPQKKSKTPCMARRDT